MRGGKRKPINWGILKFDSIQEFCDHHKITRGGVAYYIRNRRRIKFRGYKIEIVKEQQSILAQL